MKNVGLGILSWRDNDSLRETLSALTATGGAGGGGVPHAESFADLFAEKVIYFNEINDECRRIAAEFGFTAFGTPENTGIYGGFRGLAESMTSRYVLLIENDMRLVESYEESFRQVRCGLNLLESGRANVVQIAHLHKRSSSGELQYGWDSRYLRYYPHPDAPFLERLLGFLRRTLRPLKSVRVRGHAPSVTPSPELRFSNFTRDSGSGFLLVGGNCRRWSNHPFIIDRQFYIDVILDRVERDNSRRLVNGFKDIEVQTNRLWWRRAGYTVAVADPGLFLHFRVGDRGH